MRMGPCIATRCRRRDSRGTLRCTFNLFLTDEKRALVDRLAGGPRLSDFFEIHEGVHSGNIRGELFVDRRVDETCRELIFGRDEIGPYRLQWNGRFIRLAAMPAKKSRDRYANIGRAGWHEREKILVRRTGDFVLAAVDEVGRYCSNNFFVVFAKAPHALDLYGLCAWLNSRSMTEFFRMIEPRQGRVFAELKIKHSGSFPMPDGTRRDEIGELNRLGRLRSGIARELAGTTVALERERLGREGRELEQAIEKDVKRLLGS